MNRPECTGGRWLRLVEPLGPALNDVFVLTVGGRRWLGRKRPYHDENGEEYLSSILLPEMLLGHLEQIQWGDAGIAFYLKTMPPEEKQQVFHQAQHQPGSEITFTFPVMDDRGREFVCPADLWQADKPLAEQLNADEAHFREHCVALLYDSGLTPGAVIHDPACSTGQFIAQLARALPGLRCQGSDRSASMIQHAKRHHPGVTFELADAGHCANHRNRYDVLILRFLNAEVVTRADAEHLLRRQATTLKPGGLIIVFGHTPVLPAMPYMAQALGLRLESCVAARPGREELFQFYQLRSSVQ